MRLLVDGRVLEATDSGLSLEVRDGSPGTCVERSETLPGDHDWGGGFLDEVVRHGTEDDAFEFRETSGSDDDQDGLDVVDQIYQHVPSVLGMDGLTMDPDM